MASGTVFVRGIVTRAIGRFSFEVVDYEVLQYTPIIEDFGCNGRSIGIRNGGNGLVFDVRWNLRSD